MSAGLYWLAAVIAAPQSAETITVHNRFSYIICAGVCTDSDLTVRSDGTVSFRVRRIKREWQSFEYRVSQQQVREFWAAYAELRPIGIKGPIGTCEEQTGIIDKNISWDDALGHSRLLACFGVEDVRRAYNEGFRILQISPVTGEELSAHEAQGLR